MSDIPKILFFARGFQAGFYPALKPEAGDDRFEAIYVTLTREEAEQVRAKGCEVTACFEADFDSIIPAEVPDNYLITSLMSERFMGRYSHEERLMILGKEIAFWRGILDEHKPVAVCNELIAIEISEVLLIETRARAIGYLAPLYCPIEGLFYWLPDPLTLSGSKLDLPAEPSKEAYALADAYLAEVRRADYKPYYVRNLASRRALRPLATGLAKSALWSWRDRQSADPGEPGAFRYETYTEEYGKRAQVFAASFRHAYDKLDDIPDSTEIVLYPLHQEPEATLNYMSEFFSSQVATIENILKCLTPKQRLVVKEHPVDKGSLLRTKFRDLRERYSNLAFLPAEVTAREILARCERVVTLTSSVGWEAAVLGKSVCVMGEIWWDSVPGVTRIATWPELRAAMRTPIAEMERTTPEDARRFVAGLADYSHRGRPLPNPALYDPDNIVLVRDAIVQGAGLAEGSKGAKD
ncbi:MAG: hypothetical protein HRT64_12805 [Erythrobacter sp.]|nr:hypothetical protein [Erythrobacter sp.]